MKVLITGSSGFVGKNLVSHLSLNEDIEIFHYNKNSSFDELDRYTKECDFVFHLAGVTRPQDSKDFMEGNYEFTKTLLEYLKKNNNKCPIMISSSIHAALDTDYGKSKKVAEDLLFKYGKDNNVKVYVYRLPNLFGKWARPNYNSVTATICYDIANNVDLKINDENKELTLAYIDDVCEEIIKCLNGNPTKNGDYYIVPITYKKKIGYIVELVRTFKYSDVEPYDEFAKKLYKTYLSYLPNEEELVNLQIKHF